MRRGFFITVEGPEGSGKSSQAKRLVAALRRAGHRVVFVSDPGSTQTGHRLRRVLLHDRARLSPMTEALLFIAGRIQLVEEYIKPTLKRGAVVVCDRFHDSTVAYQGYGGQLDVTWLDRFGRKAIDGVMPALTLLLDVPTRVGFARLRRAHDRMEGKGVAFHRRVRAGFLRIAKAEPRRVVVIDATQSALTVQRRAHEAIVRRLKQRRSHGVV